MTGTGHVWRRGFGWAYCSRCGVVRSLDRETPCSGALPPIGTRDGEQSPTSDEREIDRLRLEVSALTALADARAAEVARLHRDSGRALDVVAAVFDDVAMAYRVSPRHVDTLRGLVRDLRAMLDQGAT